MLVEKIKQNHILLLDCISGSRSYGLHTATSDTDKRGVFVQARQGYYGLSYVEQIANDSNDEVYYELKRFIDLLSKNNPNILELLNTPEDCVLYKHRVMQLIQPEKFLSKLCNQTFAGYAQSQIKKAKGLNKKIVNPVEKERKSILDFCYVVQGQGVTGLRSWLANNAFKQDDCGLVNLPHMRDMYAVYHASNSAGAELRGISSGPEANDVLLSSVPKEALPVGVMSFNKDGYSKYCKDYREYWQWVGARNEVRYENTIEHGKNYDAKNMMHTFRLLHMAEEIAKEGRINVRRHDRDFLLNIRKGAFEYDVLVGLANEKVNAINAAFVNSGLPDVPDLHYAEQVLVEMREQIYNL
jgi:uncharacterized protein